MSHLYKNSDNNRPVNKIETTTKGFICRYASINQLDVKSTRIYKVIGENGTISVKFLFELLCLCIVETKTSVFQWNPLQPPVQFSKLCWTNL